ncbi:MAG: LptE family protein [Candidatus Omnitrophota bacterium]
MKTFVRSFTLFLMLSILAGCGYSTRSNLAGNFRSISIEPFKNTVSYSAEQATKNLYIPLLEVKITNAVTDRFLFDGNLKIADKGKADLALEGSLLNYERNALRYTDDEDVQEYRISIVVSMTLFDKSGEVVWSEPSFAGEATYFVTGPLARSENAAIEDALTDLARRIVERTVENW